MKTRNNRQACRH